MTVNKVEDGTSDVKQKATKTWDIATFADPALPTNFAHNVIAPAMLAVISQKFGPDTLDSLTEAVNTWWARLQNPKPIDVNVANYNNATAAAHEAIIDDGAPSPLEWCTHGTNDTAPTTTIAFDDAWEAVTQECQNKIITHARTLAGNKESIISEYGNRDINLCTVALLKCDDRTQLRQDMPQIDKGMFQKFIDTLENTSYFNVVRTPIFRTTPDDDEAPHDWNTFRFRDYEDKNTFKLHALQNEISMSRTIANIANQFYLWKTETPTNKGFPPMVMFKHQPDEQSPPQYHVVDGHHRFSAAVMDSKLTNDQTLLDVAVVELTSNTSLIEPRDFIDRTSTHKYSLANLAGWLWDNAVPINAPE